MKKRMKRKEYSPQTTLSTFLWDVRYLPPSPFEIPNVFLLISTLKINNNTIIIGLHHAKYHAIAIARSATILILYWISNIYNNLVFSILGK